MKRNNLTAATEVKEMDALYQEWTREHVGNYAEFVEFMATPGVEREIFFSTLKGKTAESIDNNILRTIITV